MEQTRDIQSTPAAAPRRSGWSFRIGRFLGIDVHLHGAFLILLGVVALARYGATQSALAAGIGLLALLTIFLCVVLHEYGHALVARRYGIETRRITLLPIGGVAELERMPEKPREELLVALAGPAVNLVLATLGLAVLAVSQVLAGPLDGFARQSLFFFISVNGMLFAFNLLPALPMDGGRVLRALLAMRVGPLRATVSAARIGQLFAVGMGLLGFFVNPFLLLIAVFVWMGARQEALFARARAGLGGLPVERAMKTEFHVLSPTDDVGTVVERLVRTSQRHFPVLEADGRLVGVLHPDDLPDVVQRDGRTVADVLQPGFESAEPDEALTSAFTRLVGSARPALAVLDGSRLVGLISRDDIRAFLELRGAYGPAQAA